MIRRWRSPSLRAGTLSCRDSRCTLSRAIRRRRVMALPPVPPEVAAIALDRVEGTTFEQFANAFLASLSGTDFVPLGGTKDGGADAFVASGLLERKNRPTHFVQASVERDYASKIKRTVARLREVGRTVEVLTYVTSQSVRMLDQVEESLGAELDVSLRIRDRQYIISHLNDTQGAAAAFESFLRPVTAFLQQLGSARLITASKHVSTPAVYVFLQQEVERRGGEVSLLEAVVESLILLALEGTDPDRGVFRTREEVRSRVEGLVPPARALVKEILDRCLDGLASKRHAKGRAIRWHKKEDLFCLPFETRRALENENIQDESLRIQVSTTLEQRLRENRSTSLDEKTIAEAAELALRSVQLTFEREGLEFSNFLATQQMGADFPTIADSVTIAMDEQNVPHKARAVLGDAILEALRQSFYASTEDERLYFGKLSRTYALLFTLNTEPRLVEFFQEMSADFVLLVGADIIVRALSERYLPKADQMTRNILRLARDAGAKLLLPQPVLEEVIGNLRSSNREYRNFYEPIESDVSVEIAREIPKILVRAYYYARLQPAPGVAGPGSWRKFVSQFCDYASLDRAKGQAQLRKYLIAEFGLEFVSRDELREGVDEKDCKELADRIAEIKQTRNLAENDALLATAVYAMRVRSKEDASASEFGYRTWWLTGERGVVQKSRDLIRKSGAGYAMRPEFLLNFMALAPNLAEIRETYRAVFPTLMGIRLARRMDEKVFHKLLDRVKDAADLEPGRRQAAISELSDQLKADFRKRYAVSLTG